MLAQAQWYPGHMVRTQRAVREALACTDIVIEVVDARIPRSGRYPMLDELTRGRKRFVTLTRDDLADPAVTQAWLHRLEGAGMEASALDARARRKVGHFVRAVAQDAAGRKGIARSMIVGVPNSGKSTIVNALLRRAKAKTENRAGVTRQLQWFRLSPTLELLDTPGVLPPKIVSPAARWKLALCGALPQNRFDAREVADAFHRWSLVGASGAGVPDLAAFAAQRGFLRKGGQTDLNNAARAYIRVFNEGGFGQISLEHPDDAEAA
ncbi:MAG: ribosome biogenesis GTPase YlqF [Candidatus Eremiobacteraeota bacterium]|nr:ribosome biogenesis GTPase YlqF [Candidatus Eremiobacteraeota bacterium]